MTIAFGLMNGGSVVLAADSREIIGIPPSPRFGC